MRTAVFFALLFAGVFAASMANEVSQGEAAAPGLDPGNTQTAGVAWLNRNDDGHYYAEAMVAAEGESAARVRFMVDTGASMVALTRADAARLGVEVDELAFVHRVNTAGGQVGAAFVQLDRVSVSGVALDDVEAMVLSSGLHQSLLGMSYLGRLSKMEANGDALILRR